LALQRLPETLAVAHEYIQMPVLEGQHEEVSKLLKDLKNEYDSKDQKLMKRFPQIIKAHMLILAQTSRKVHTLSAQMASDARKIGALIPGLLEELFKLSSMPINRAGHMFARPHISTMEFYQCFTQAVPISVRKASEKDASLMQLPHFDAEKVLKLTKKAAKPVHTVQKLLELPKEDREKMLKDVGGFSAGMVQDIERQLLMIPQATTFEASFDCDGDSKILEGDFITAKVNVKIARAGGPLGGAVAPTPFCVADRKEGWRLFIMDGATNTMLRVVQLDKATLRRCESGDGAEEITVQFPAPQAGSYLFSATLMSDYWIGVDAKAAVHVKIGKRTSEALQSREPKAGGKSCCGDSSHGHGHSHGDVSDSASASDGDDDDDDEAYSSEEDGYPSDETGTSESDDSVPVARRTQPLPQKPAPKAERPAEDASKASDAKQDDDTVSSNTDVSNID
jgi:translocation protein SEC63